MVDAKIDNSMATILRSAGLSEGVHAEALEQVAHLMGHRPIVALLGKTGAGKSSLGNTLFGKEVFPVSSVKAGTRKPNPIAAAINGVDITLIDFPGVGESEERDEEYRALYREWIAEIDVVLWVIKMDDRVLSPDLDYFERVIKPAGISKDRIVFVISQVDKADPVREWSVTQGRPSKRQGETIIEKQTQLREVFGISQDQIVSVSAEERYNLEALAETIVRVCPNKSALSIARAFEDQYKTEQVRKTVFQKVWAAIKAFYGGHSEELHKAVISIVVELLQRRRR